MAKVLDLPVMNVKTLPGNSVETTERFYKNPRTFNIEVTTANDDVTYPLPLGTRKFLLRTNKGKVVLTYDDGSLMEPVTLPPKSFYSEGNIDPATVLTLLFQSNFAPDTLEIVLWE